MNTDSNQYLTNMKLETQPLTFAKRWPIGKAIGVESQQKKLYRF